MSNKKVVIVGGGPAGLTASLELLKKGKFEVDLLEKDSCVGGLSRTTEYKGCKFDIGPHHFITENQSIEKWWKDLMQEEEAKGNKFEELRRFTRIYYNKHFFYYPLKPFNALFGLSVFESVRCVLSYVKIRLFPIKKVNSFQDWVTNKFGYRLFSIFFKTYTEKLWGIKCRKISCDWAAQRIKGFSLSKAIFYAFFGNWFKKNAPRTLSDKFYYPTNGAGTLWNKVGDKIQEFGGKINLDKKVIGIKHKDFKIKSFLTVDPNSSDSGAKKITEFDSDYFFSTMPVKNLILSLDPLPAKSIVDAAKRLKYRSIITVNLIADKKDICPDHWLYIHEKEVDMVRIGNMNNFSVKMVNKDNYTALSLEYFAFFNDGLWNLSDKELVELGKKELDKIRIVKEDKLLDGMVIREEHAYPVYIGNYKQDLKTVLDYLAKFDNLQLMGRNGLHKYNNMDIAMISAMDAVDCVLKQEQKTDSECINIPKQDVKNKSLSV